MGFDNVLKILALYIYIYIIHCLFDFLNVLVGCSSKVLF